LPFASHFPPFEERDDEYCRRRGLAQCRQGMWQGSLSPWMLISGGPTLMALKQLARVRKTSSGSYSGTIGPAHRIDRVRKGEMAVSRPAGAWVGNRRTSANVCECRALGRVFAGRTQTGPPLNGSLQHLLRQHRQPVIPLRLSVCRKPARPAHQGRKDDHPRRGASTTTRKRGGSLRGPHAA